MGYSDIARKNLTTKMPVAAILVELNLIAEARGLVIDVSWVPRLQNEEADALTNADFRLFTASNRVHIDLEKIELSLYRSFSGSTRTTKKSSRSRSGKGKNSRRQRESWRRKRGGREQPTPTGKLAPGKGRQATAGKDQRPEEKTAGGPQRKRKIPEWKRRVPLREKDP